MIRGDRAMPQAHEWRGRRALVVGVLCSGLVSGLRAWDQAAQAAHVSYSYEKVAFREDKRQRNKK